MKTKALLTPTFAIAFLISTAPAWAGAPTCPSLFGDRAIPTPLRTVVNNSIQERVVQLTDRESLIGSADASADGAPSLNGGRLTAEGATNLLHILFDWSSAGSDRFENSESALEIVKDLWQADSARSGGTLLLADMPLALPAASQAISGRPNEIEAAHYSLEQNAFTEVLIEPQPNILNLVTVTATSENPHAILILGLDRRTQTIAYADANNPYVRKEVRYAIGQHNGRRTIKLGLGRAFATDDSVSPGWITGLLKVRYVTNPLSGRHFGAKP